MRAHDLRSNRARLSRMPEVTVSAVRSVPRQAEVVGWAVAPKGPVPRQLGLNRAGLEAHGFTAKVSGPYGTYLRWVWPLLALLTLLVAIVLAVSAVL